MDREAIMTVRRDRDGAMQAECDTCHHTVDFEDGEDFNDVRRAIEDDGWALKRVDGRWRNMCVDCVGKQRGV
jgi:hypothetical protein